jgi:hypothetical protein
MGAGGSQTHRQHSDFISLLLFFQNKKIGRMDVDSCYDLKSAVFDKITVQKWGHKNNKILFLLIRYDNTTLDHLNQES